MHYNAVEIILIVFLGVLKRFVLDLLDERLGILLALLILNLLDALALR